MAATYKIETFQDASLATAQAALQVRVTALNALQATTPTAVGPISTSLIFDGTNYIFTLQVVSDEPTP